MTTIPQNDKFSQISTSIIARFFRRVGIGKLLRSSGITKLSGVSTLSLFHYIFSLVFVHQNHYRAMQSEQKPFAQDTVYRFLNEGRFHWEKFLLRLAVVSTDIVRSWSNSSSRALALVIDDTVFERNRSTKVELLSKVYDHVHRRFLRGYQMLTLAWTDGQTVIPCQFRMVASQKESNLYAPARADLDRRTIAARRRREAQSQKPALVLDMLRRVAEAGIIAHYVLMDSWFYMPGLLAEIAALGFTPIVRMRKMNWPIFFHGSRWLKLEDVYRRGRKHASSAFFSCCVSMKTSSGMVPVRIAFGRPKKGKSEWFALITTDVTLDHEDMLRIYGKRWDIEPMFRVCKEHLRLTREFQTRSLDATIAQVTIVLTRYTCLAVERRFDDDPRAWGDLLRICMDEIADLTFQDAIERFAAFLLDALAERFQLDLESCREVISEAVSALPRLSLSPFAAFSCP